MTLPIQRYARVLVDQQPHYVQLGSPANAPGVLLGAAPWSGGRPTGAELAADALASGSARLLCPLQPSKIVGIGRNYRKHAEELKHDVPEEPLVFLKPPSALLDPGGTVVLPPESNRVDYEGELAVVIGRRVRRIAPSQALNAVFGYTIACDVTARDLQNKDKQWARAKGFDTFCPLGPYVVPLADPGRLRVRLSVNGELRQDGNTADMLFDVATLVAYVSNAMTLEPGDVILTGTPEGVGPLSTGDAVQVGIDPIGELSFGVVAAS